MSLYERYPSHGSNILHHMLMDGDIFAMPHISPGTGHSSMRIIGWNFDDGCESVIDGKLLSGGYASIHNIPMRVLDSVFQTSDKEGVQFLGGGLTLSMATVLAPG